MRQRHRPTRHPARRRLATLLATVLLAGLTPLLAPAPAAAIVGGQPTPGGEFAYVAEVRNTTAGALCTGSLIHPSWVLTAAHCAVPVSVGDVSVRIGNNVSNTGGETRRITRIVAHPQYIGGHNDLALLELSSPVTTITPVRLSTPSQAYLWDGTQGGPFTPYDQGVAVGWGRDGTGNLPTRLQFVGVFITPPQPDNLGIKRIMVDRGPCQGDSGGPLLVYTGGEYVQAGVLKAASCTGIGSYSEVGAGSNRTWLLNQLTALPYTTFGAVDWDRDGHADIVTRQEATGELWLYPGQSRRGVSTADRARIGIGWRGYSFFGAGDWDADGHADILTRNDTTGDLWLYAGQSRRSVSTETPVRIRTGLAGYTPYGIADWDRDGHADLIVRQDSTGDVWLYPGQSTRGSITASPVRIAAARNAFSSFGVLDWDRDGHVDLIGRDNDTGNLWLYPGQSVRGVSTIARVQIGNGWRGYSFFGAGDWDADGHADILTRNDTTGDLWLYAGQSRRGYSTETPVRIGWGW